MAVEKNNLEIGVIERWLVQTLGHDPGKPRELPRRASIGNVEIAEQGVFFVGGAYNDPVNPTFMSGQMYVRTRFERAERGRVPSGPGARGGQLGTSFTGTPTTARLGGLPAEPRLPGVRRGSAGTRQVAVHHCGLRPRGVPNLQSIEDLFSDGAGHLCRRRACTPVAGNRSSGRYAFDQFFASQWSGMNATMQEQTTSRALVALLEKIGPAFLITHSQSGPHGWEAADARRIW